MVKSLAALPRWLAFGLALPLAVLNGWGLLILLGYFDPIATQVVTALLLMGGFTGLNPVWILASLLLGPRSLDCWG
ncbi:MAG: hypothetical protein ACFB5Z_04540 [Elainellaceae cyanobacterium]